MAEAVLLSLVKLRDAHVTLMQAYGRFDDEPSPAFLVEVAAFQQAASAAGAGIAGPDERFEAQSVINYWQTVRINAGQRPATILLAEFDHSAARREAGETPPYKGLAPFLTSDNAFFSGRYDLVRTMVTLVRSRRLLALTGLSGSGKSSVVRAGLIPDLAGGAYDGIDDDGLTDSATWAYPPPVLPGADPLAALEAVYGPLPVPADLPAALDRAGAPVLLAIDQFEEVFTLSQPGPRRTLFLDALVAAASAGTHRHVVVITMRSEYDVFVQSHAAFGALFKAGRIVIEAMQSGDLRKAIEEPAKRLGVGFDPGLIDELMTRVQGEPAGLPLLQFTLLELWKRCGGGPMRMADYQALGGNPRDILARRADEVFTGLKLQQDQDLAQGIFTRLVRIGDSLEATSRRIKRADLDTLGARDNLDRVLGLLTASGLVRTAPAGAITPAHEIEVAHEALIRNWGRLTGWVKDSFGQQTNRKAFALRAQRWKSGEGDLLAGLALEEAQAFPAPTPIEAAYVTASARHARNSQRRKWAATIMLGLLAIGLAVASFQLYRLRNADTARTRQIALIAASDSLIERGDTLLAKKIMLAGLARNADPPPAMQAALQAASLSELGEQVLTVPGGKAALGLSLSNDGKRLMSVWGDGKARVWQNAGANWRDTPVVLAVPGRTITAAALAPDGKTAVTASRHAAARTDDESAAHGGIRIEVWQIDGVAPGAMANPLTHFQYAEISNVASVKYAPDGKTLVLAASDGLAYTINARSGAPGSVLGDEGRASTTALFSPRGDRILKTTADGEINLFDAATDVLVMPPIYSGNAGITSARFTETGARFVVGTDKGNLIVYSAVDGEKLLNLPGHAKAVTSVAFAPDSSMIASGSKDGTVRLWEHGITSGRLLRTIPVGGQPGDTPVAVNAVTFAPDGDTIAIARDNAEIRLLKLTGRKLVTETPLLPNLPGTRNDWRAVSHDRRIVVTMAQALKWDEKKGILPTRLDVWDIVGGKRQMTLAMTQHPFDVAVAPDGSRLAVIDSAKSTVSVEIFAVRGGASLFKAAIPDFTEMLPSAPGAAPEPISSQDFPLDTGFSGDGGMFAMIMVSGKLLVWRGGKALTELPIAPGLMRTKDGLVDMASDPILEVPDHGPVRFALASAQRPDIDIYDGVTGKAVPRFRASGNVAVMRFSNDGSAIFVGSDDGNGAIWDPATGKPLARLNGRHDNAIDFAAFSRDGTILITTSIDGSARLWNAATGALLHILDNSQGSLNTAEFSNNGKRVITGAENRVATLWDVATGKRLTVLPGPRKSGSILGWFAANDSRAITLSEDTTLRTWNIATRDFNYQALVKDACADGGTFSADERQRNNLDIDALPVCRAVQ